MLFPKMFSKLVIYTKHLPVHHLFHIQYQTQLQETRTRRRKTLILQKWQIPGPVDQLALVCSNLFMGGTFLLSVSVVELSNKWSSNQFPFHLGSRVGSLPEGKVNQEKTKGGCRKEKEKWAALFDLWILALPEAHGLFHFP